jgi:hypothetical protein
MSSRVRIPAPILILFAIDLALGLVFVLNYWAGEPSRRLTVLIDLDGEANLPAWYSSILWFCTAGLLGLFAYRNFKVSSPRSWALAGLALLFLLFSLDEVARLHEWLGRLSDALLPGGERANTTFAATGIWIFVIGLPVIVVLGALLWSVRSLFKRAPGALTKVVLGMFIMLSGALVIETFDNFVAAGSSLRLLQVFVEEMLELLGSTVVLWGGLELLTRSGIVLARRREAVVLAPNPPAATASGISQSLADH